MNKDNTTLEAALPAQQCKYPKCSYPCTDLPDCRDAEQPAQQALDKKAENARELGLDYEPSQDNSNYRLDPPGLDPLYATPPAQQEPLSEEWIAYCWRKSMIGPRIRYVEYLALVRETERAHGIKGKNT